MPVCTNEKLTPRVCRSSRDLTKNYITSFTAETFSNLKSLSTLYGARAFVHDHFISS